MANRRLLMWRLIQMRSILSAETASNIAADNVQTLDILERLIAFDTTSRNPNLALITYIDDLLRGAGLRTQIIPSECGTKGNLFASTGPQGVAGIMLSGHTDVVPVDGQDWSVPPFELTLRDGRAYGRGTADMKGFVASAVAMALLAAQTELKTPLHLAFSYDEEIGCVGVRSLIDMLAQAPEKTQLCIVGEPTLLGIATGHKGKVGMNATFRGREGHSALAPFAMNALHLTGDFMTGLLALQSDFA